LAWTGSILVLLCDDLLRMGLLIVASLIVASSSPRTRILDGRLNLHRVLLGALVCLYDQLRLCLDLWRGSWCELRLGCPCRPRVERGGHPGPWHEAWRCREPGLLKSVAGRNLDVLVLGGHHRSLLLCDLLSGLGGLWLGLLFSVQLGWSFLELAGRGRVGQLLWRKDARH
jgi:hypothetical protein